MSVMFVGWRRRRRRGIQGVKVSSDKLIKVLSLECVGMGNDTQTHNVQDGVNWADPERATHTHIHTHTHLIPASG